MTVPTLSGGVYRNTGKTEATADGYWSRSL